MLKKLNLIFFLPVDAVGVDVVVVADVIVVDVVDVVVVDIVVVVAVVVDVVVVTDAGAASQVGINKAANFLLFQTKNLLRRLLRDVLFFQ